MNNEPQLTHEQLLAATAPPHQPTSGVALDASAALLRERFLAFGRAALQSAEGVDEAQLLARLQAECFEQELAPRMPRRRASLLLLAGALAASAVVAAVGITAVQMATHRPPLDPVVVAPQRHDQQAAEPRIAQNHTPAAPEPRSPSGVSVAGVSATDVSAWDDPLDGEIQAAQSRLAGLRGQGGVDGTLTSLSAELDSIFYDLEGGSL